MQRTLTNDVPTEATHEVKSPLRYPGGKSKAIQRLMLLFPAEFEEFREPMVGGGSIFLAVKHHYPKHHRIWINDLNVDVYGFWQQMQAHPTEVIAGVRAIRDRFQTLPDFVAFARTWTPTDPVERAVRFFVLNRCTFSGLGDSGGFSPYAFEHRFTPSAIHRLTDLPMALSSVTITNTDYSDVIHAPGERVFMLLDPPYHVAKTHKLYGKHGEFHTSFDHARLADDLRRCPHYWLMTLDDCDYIRDLFSFAHIYRWDLQYGMGSFQQEHLDKTSELVICNYEPPHLHIWGNHKPQSPASSLDRFLRKSK